MPPQVRLAPHTATPPSLLPPPGLLVAGGYPETAYTSVEYWSPGSPAFPCSLPPLSRATLVPSLDYVQGRVVACYLDDCHFLTSTGWQHLVTSLHSRQYHTSAPTSKGLLLVGGYNSSSATELVEGAATREGFTLHNQREGHCSIQLSDSSIVLTGGYSSLSLVTEYSDIHQQEASPRELGSLLTGRYGHACGSYLVADKQVTLI